MLIIITNDNAKICNSDLSTFPQISATHLLQGPPTHQINNFCPCPLPICGHNIKIK